MFISCQQCKMMKNGIHHTCEYVLCTEKLKPGVYCSEVCHSCSSCHITSFELDNLIKCNSCNTLTIQLVFFFTQVFYFVLTFDRR